MKTTVQTVDAIVTALEAATWTPTGGSPETAFEAVHRFDVSDKARAMQTLLISDARVALVIYMSEDWDPQNTEDSGQLVLRRTQNILVLVSDRNKGRRDTAAFGDAHNPGALGLKDVAVQTLSGNLIAHPDAVNIRPIRAEVEQMESNNELFPDRVFCSIQCLATGGRIIGDPAAPVA